jgi:SAM-dependent methyltransferase
MLNALKRHYQQQMVQPGLVGLFVNPFYFARKGLFHEVSTLSGHVAGRVLDVGCGYKPYEHLFRATEYVGLEIDTPENRARKRADVFYDGTTFPFESASFDSLVCNQVLEHVFEPDRFVREMARVLKPGGHLLLTVPFAWDEHEQPWDFARYSSFGLAAVLHKGGFEILEHRKTMADIRTLFQLLNAYLYKVTVTGSAYVNLALTLVLMAPFNVMGSLLAWITPGNPDLYLDNVVLARKGTT